MMFILKHTGFDRLFTTLPCIQPYQPFSKSDRLGKVSDWTGATYQDRRFSTTFYYVLDNQYLKLHFLTNLLCRHMTKYQSQYGAGGTQYSYYYEEDDSTFQLVRT